MGYIHHFKPLIMRISYKKRKLKQPAQKKAFTLVETLLAVTVLIFIILSVISLSHHSLLTWHHAAASLEKQSQAVECYDRLIEDLESALFKNDAQKWLGCGPLKVGLISAQDSCWLRFFINTDKGVQAVSYHIRPFYPASATSAQMPFYGLYRHLSNSQLTLDSLLGQLERAELSSFYNPEQSDKKTFINASLLIPYVLGFEIKFFYHTTPDALQSIDATLSECFFPLETADQKRVPFPAFAEIKLTIIEDRGIQQLINRGMTNKVPFLNESIKKHATTYTRRIIFHTTTFW